MSDPLNTCGCYSADEVSERDGVVNDPGQSALSYRVGTYASFRAAILRELAYSQDDVDRAALASFTTRDADDPTIAMIGAYAAGLDVLTFYQERIANEAFLRTAIERRSVGYLADAIGYLLNPGVAASTYIAFTVDDAKGAPTEVRLDVGTKVQSEPAQDETAQMFETIEEVTARLEWNALKVQTRKTVLPVIGSKTLTIQGTGKRLKVGDLILIVGNEREKDKGSERWDVRKLSKIEEDSDHDITVLTWDEGLGYNRRGLVIEPTEEDVQIFCFRTRANLFGYNAPSLETMRLVASETSNITATGKGDWPNFNISYKADLDAEWETINLDQAYSTIVVDSWVILAKATYTEAYRVTSAVEDGLTAFTLSGRSTRLELSGENLVEKFGTFLRETAVFGESEEFLLGEEVLTEPVSGKLLTLESLVADLADGQMVSISGTLEGSTEAYSAAVRIAKVGEEDGLTVLELESELPALDGESVRINANVAKATHGETKEERLGSGDASRRFQEFKLTQTPLTFVAADTPSGAASTIELKVDGTKWSEVSTLYGAGPRDRSYTARLDDDGKTTVAFGDGVSGARLRSGTDNVRAKYRVGIGLDGMVKAGQIKLLQSRPLGLKEATNPSAPEGAADPEQLEAARQNAPLTVLTLDRVVSLQDHEDFARAFGGVGKARADLVWGARDREVFITIAGETEDAATDELASRLQSAIHLSRHPGRPVSIGSCEMLLFNVEARIKHDEFEDGELVRATALLAAVEAFGFEQASIARPVALSDVMAVLQSTAGVVAVQVDVLYLNGRTRRRNNQLVALPATLVGSAIQPAQMLVTDASRIVITEMTI